MSYPHIIPHSQPTLSEKEVTALTEVVRSGQLSMGKQVEMFEQELSQYIGIKGGVALNSGTSALHLALLALGIKENDQVIIPSFTCCALLNAIHYVRAKAVLVDIDPDGYNLDIKAVKKALDKRTKAIIVPHMFGLPADIGELTSLGIPLIEDCAHSLGAGYQGIKTGRFGLLAVFSFYATKLITTGEGGMVGSNSEELLEKIKDLREYDQKDDYKIRYNYKMTDLQAALGRVQLSRLPRLIIQRQKIAQRYLTEFKDLSLHLPCIPHNREHIFYRFVIRSEKDAHRIITALQEKGINCARPVYKPLHHYLGQTNFSHTDSVWEKSVSLPIYPSLAEKDIARIIDGVRDVYAG
jgi:perosamine synthetase